MAAVTVNSQRSNVTGSYRETYYNITGSSGDTLATPYHLIECISFNDTTISKAAPSGVPATITFTAGGAITDELVRVVGL